MAARVAGSVEHLGFGVAQREGVAVADLDIDPRNAVAIGSRADVAPGFRVQYSSSRTLLRVPSVSVPPPGIASLALSMLEYQDVEERKAQLALLRGIEHLVWFRVNGQENEFAPVAAISNEDLERSSDEKTSAVHFMRFELDEKMIAALRAGAGLAM